MAAVRLNAIRACVFDAYGTLFDVNAAVAAESLALGQSWQALGELWRAKQLQYTWLRSLTGDYADFWQLTGDALDFALASLRIDDADLRRRLMESYLRLGVYPDAPEMLARLKDSGHKLAILSNGSPSMLSAACSHAGIAELLDDLISVDSIRVYKPARAVYRLAEERLALDASEICFVSANGWDAFSAKRFGFRVVWCNRSGQPTERVPETPDAEIATLAALPRLLLP